MTVRHALWLKTQEVPLEMSVAMVSVFAGVGRILDDYHNLSIFSIALWCALLLGGVCTIYGCLKADLDFESIGLALMVGGFWFTTLRSVGRAENTGEVFIAMLRYGAFASGLLIRLRVVRKAVRAGRFRP